MHSGVGGQTGSVQLWCTIHQQLRVPDLPPDVSFTDWASCPQQDPLVMTRPVVISTAQSMSCWYGCNTFSSSCWLKASIKWYESIQRVHTSHHQHHVRVAGKGRCVTPVPWPRRIADLHNVEGMLPLSLRTWLTHLLFGRPERRFQSRPGRRPCDRSTWARRAWWAGTSSLSLAIWPKIATWRLAICSPTDARPVCDETVHSSAKVNLVRIRSPDPVDFQNLTGTSLSKDASPSRFSLRSDQFFHRHEPNRGEMANFTMSKDSSEKFLDPDPKTDDFQHFTGSSLPTDPHLWQKFSRRSDR